MEYNICRKCKSQDIDVVDNMMMETSFEWGIWCNNCQDWIDDLDVVEETEKRDREPHKILSVEKSYGNL